MYSTPQHLGAGLTNTTGPATFDVMVPVDLLAGSHTLVAVGLNSSGATATASVVIAVVASGDLAGTGWDGGWLPLAAVLLLLAGLAAVRAARRRTVVSVHTD